MKVLFAASHRGKEVFSEYYLLIYHVLEDEGFNHVNKDIVAVDSQQFYDQLEDDGAHGFVKKHEQMLNELKHADIGVFECSAPSFAIGYLVDKALQDNVPVVAFYKKNHIPHFLAGIDDEKFQLIEYKDKDDLQKKIKESVKKAVELMDKRFNFFISPQLLAYLNKISREQRMSKSNFIRNLIQEHMRKH